MVSRENRVLLVTTALALLSLAATFALAPPAYSSVLSVLALVGVGLVLPQLYLAANGDGLSVTRIRTGLLVGAGYALVLGKGPGERTLATVYDFDITDQRIIAVFAALLFFGLLAYELVTGFREGSGRAGETA